MEITWGESEALALGPSELWMLEGKKEPAKEWPWREEEREVCWGGGVGEVREATCSKNVKEDSIQLHQCAD